MTEQPGNVDERMSAFERSMRRLTAIQIAVAALTGLIIVLQWNEMRKGGRDTHDLAEAAKVQAGAAMAQSEASRLISEQAKAQSENTAKLATFTSQEVKQLANSVKEAHAATEHAERSLQASERPWVTVDVGEKTGNFAVTMRNAGKSPAINVTEVTAFSGGKRGVVPEVDLTQNSSSPISLPKNTPHEFLERLKKDGYIRDRPPTGYVIAPGATQIASDYQGKFTQIFRIEGDRVYVQGRVTYDDIFGKPHETIFCYWFAPPSDFVMCNDHNQMN